MREKMHDIEEISTNVPDTNMMIRGSGRSGGVPPLEIVRRAAQGKSARLASSNGTTAGWWMRQRLLFLLLGLRRFTNAI